MGAIYLYRGNLHRVPDTPRRWPTPPRAISLSQFRRLLLKRTLAFSRSRSQNRNPNPGKQDSVGGETGCPKEDPRTRDSSSEPNRSDAQPQPVDMDDARVAEALKECDENRPAMEGLDSKEVLCSLGSGGGNGDGKEEVIHKLDTTDDKEDRKRDLEKKLHVLNEKKHYLVQMLKQILNAEEEIKLKSIQSSLPRPSIPPQAETSVDMGYAAKNPPKISVEVNFGGDLGEESDAAANHSIQARQWPHVQSTSPSAPYIGRNPHGPFQHNMVHTPRGSVLHQTTSSSLMASSTASPSRFAPTGQQGHSMSLPSVSISGSHFAASSPSPAASGGTTSIFRDPR